MFNGEGVLGLALLGVGAGIYTFARGLSTYRLIRFINDTRTIPIRSVAMGLVRVRGQAGGEQTLLSPIAHTACYIFKVIVEEWHTDLRGEGKWKQTALDIQSVPFELTDDSGRVRVDATGAEFDLPWGPPREVDSRAARASSESNTQAAGASAVNATATDTELLQYIAQAQARRPLWIADDDPRARRVRVVLEHHDPGGRMLRAALEVWKQPESSAEFQARLNQFAEAYARALATSKGGRPPAAVSKDQAHQDLMTLMAALAAASARPQMDSGDEQARHAAGAYASQHLAEGAARETSTPTGLYRLVESCLLPGVQYDITGTCAENPQPRHENDRNIILKGTNDPTFLISSRSQKEVELELRKKAPRMVLGGAALAIACLAIFLWRLGLL
jgi:hypothetical protein